MSQQPAPSNGSLRRNSAATDTTVAGKTYSSSSKYRSDATRPARAAAIPSSGAGLATATGITRQPSSGRSSRSSIGSISANGAPSGSASRQSSGSLIGTITAPAAASTAQGTFRQHGLAVVAQQAAPAGATELSTPVTSGVSFQSNALFNQADNSMTFTIRKQEYRPSLSPEMKQITQAGATAASRQGPVTSNGDTQQQPYAAHQQQQQLVVQQLVQQQPVHQQHSSAVAQEPNAYLRTAGDLFATTDQQRMQDPLVVNVCGAKLVSPPWNQTRCWLTGSWMMQYPREFVAESGRTGTASDHQIPPLQQLATLGAADQESVLVDDLLTVFMGQVGEYVRHEAVEGAKWRRIGFRVHGVTDPSLQEQVERLLPVCECAYVIKRFAETRSSIEYPKTVQALAAAMRKLQEEWWLLVVQLENQMLQGQLSLATLVYYCQAPAASLELLASIAGEAADCGTLTSAGLLNLLAARQRSLAGDRPGQQLVGQLLESAAEPYFAILRRWLCWGQLEDPYQEFMVKEDLGVSPDSLTPDGQPAYWSQRYRLKGAVIGAAGEFDVPEFLFSNKEAILVTGKHLNVIRQCGQPVPPVPDTTLAKLRYDAAAAEAGAPSFLVGIHEALSAAAGALLNVMWGPQGHLMSWLYCLKHFFLLDQGDLLVHIMEQADAADPPGSLAPFQLQGMIDTALRSSSVAANPHIIEVSGIEGILGAVLDKRSILQLVTAATCGVGMEQQEMLLVGNSRTAAGRSSCLDLLLLTVKIGWPLSLVVSRRQLLHYQVLFKLLLSLKWAERDLGRLWQAMTGTKRLSREDQTRFRPWHLLCSQLLYVVGELDRFTTIDVLEPLWGDMQDKLKQAGNMDMVISLHNAFLSAALERALLTQAEVVGSISKLLAAAHDLAAEGSGLLDTAPASRGASQQLGQQEVDNLQVMSLFCQDENRQRQLHRLQQQVEDALQLLVFDLNKHYQVLLTAAPAAGFAAASKAGSMAGFGKSGSGSDWGLKSFVGDSSRELASLHNLIERLDLGSKMGGFSRVFHM